jgi:hypothetical protein
MQLVDEDPCGRYDDVYWAILGGKRESTHPSTHPPSLVTDFII